MHNRKAGIAFVGMGAVLLIAALLLLLYNEGSNAVKKTENQDIYEELYQIIERQKAEKEAEEDTNTVEPPVDMIAFPVLLPETGTEQHTEPEESPVSPAMMVSVIEGYDYIGILEISALDLAVPVLSDWNDEKLEIAPCRHFGSVRTNDLVIAGHNYRRHFLYLYKLTAGDSVTFTEMDGTVTEYEVTEKRTLRADDVDIVLESDHDLILYTCTYSGTKRTVVFCERTMQE